MAQGSSLLRITKAKDQDDWMVFGSGYLQHMGDANQGVPSMAADFEETYRPAGVRVELRRWNDDWDDLAEWIFRRCSNPENVRLLCAIYSWGAGFGFHNFAHSCRNRGIKISAAVICDGVSHLGGRICHRIGLSQIAAFWPPRVWGLRGMRRLHLWLPNNIAKDNMYWFTQENSRLRGHDIYWEDTRQLAERKKVLDYPTHSYIDESTEFKEKVAELAEQLFSKAA